MELLYRNCTDGWIGLLTGTSASVDVLMVLHMLLFDNRCCGNHPSMPVIRRQEVLASGNMAALPACCADAGLDRSAGNKPSQRVVDGEPLGHPRQVTTPRDVEFIANRVWPD